ncbi:hypothetical protein FE697_011270 [Mumia zhuanghuii]|uniref:Uncharacterized protein n=2 Tax=Mumia TaxID=1546255 RepID=A0ABW1QEX8_9ACTN|nr:MULTISPECIES: hypothetical protein [Mumia]KAA1422740.1 hypothetical protein FE697_011270 [Mumia zhuanghuii]
MAWMTWDDVSCFHCRGDAAVQVGTGPEDARSRSFLCAACDDLRQAGDVEALAQRWVDADGGRRGASHAPGAAASVLNRALEKVRPPASEDQALRPLMTNFHIIEWGESSCNVCDTRGTVLELLVFGDPAKNEFFASAHALCATCADLWLARNAAGLRKRFGGSTMVASVEQLLAGEVHESRPRRADGSYVTSSRRTRD